MGIPFTKYIRPEGKREQIIIHRPLNIETCAEEIRAKGYTFACEELPKDLTSLTVESPHEEEGDVVIKLCRTGPDVLNAVDLLVREAYVLVVGNRGAGQKRRREK